MQLNYCIKSASSSWFRQDLKSSDTATHIVVAAIFPSLSAGREKVHIEGVNKTAGDFKNYLMRFLYVMVRFGCVHIC